MEFPRFGLLYFSLKNGVIHEQGANGFTRYFFKHI